MNSDHQNLRNKDDCIWTLVCRVPIYLPVQRLGFILRCPSDGLDINDVEVNLDERDEVSHRFLSDDMTVLKFVVLRPKAQILQHSLIRSIQPHTERYEKVYKRDFQALYAIYSSQHINWAKVVLDKFLTVCHKRSFKTIFCGNTSCGFSKT